MLLHSNDGNVMGQPNPIEATAIVCAINYNNKMA